MNEVYSANGDVIEAGIIKRHFLLAMSIPDNIALTVECISPVWNNGAIPIDARRKQEGRPSWMGIHRRLNSAWPDNDTPVRSSHGRA